MKILASISCNGKLLFYEVDADEVAEFVEKQILEGNIVVAITSGEVKELASGKKIEFNIERSE